MNRIGIVCAILFVACVWGANWLVTKYGVVSVGFGLTAPAGVFLVGISFTLRDCTGRLLGRGPVIVCIIAGCLLAWLIGAGGTIPGGHVSLAVASACAFLFSEFADMGVYEPLAERSFVGSIAASNVVGAVVDSMLFLWLAFGSWSGLLAGQVWGKLLMTALALPVVYGLRRRLTPAAA